MCVRLPSPESEEARPATLAPNYFDLIASIGGFRASRPRSGPAEWAESEIRWKRASFLCQTLAQSERIERRIRAFLEFAI